MLWLKHTMDNLCGGPEVCSCAYDIGCGFIVRSLYYIEALSFPFPSGFVLQKVLDIVQKPFLRLLL